jgi:hypothetical protein
LFSHSIYANQQTPAKPIFKLTKGQGIEVCDAYLKRLNNSDYRRFSFNPPYPSIGIFNPPYCGRPEDDSVPGFTRLNQVPLNAEEIYALQSEMYRFQHYFREKINQKKFLEIYGNLKSVQRFMDTNRLGAWRYNPPVDIDNDGQPDNVLIWFSAAGAGGCGSLNGNDTYPEGGSYTANILDAKNQVIDEKRTEELFEHPIGNYPLFTKNKFFGFADGFNYIGLSMGIFAYKNVYYFDTFFDYFGDFQGKRRDYFKNIPLKRKHPMTATLGVLQRKNGKTKQVCEYYWINWQDLESKH